MLRRWIWTILIKLRHRLSIFIQFIIIWFFSYDNITNLNDQLVFYIQTSGPIDGFVYILKSKVHSSLCRNASSTVRCAILSGVFIIMTHLAIDFIRSEANSIHEVVNGGSNYLYT